MLTTLRNKASGFFVKILLGVLVVAFAAWGIDDVFRGGTQTAVAEVGDIDIDATNYEREFHQQLRNIQAQSGQILTNEQARQSGLDRMVLFQMIADALFELEAHRLGLTASDDVIRQNLASTEAFRNPMGQYDPEIARQVLAANGISVEAFVADISARSKRLQIDSAVRSLEIAPGAFVTALYRILSEERIVEYFLLTPSVTAETDSPDEAALQSFYKENTERFALPEYRSFNLIVVTSDHLVEEITVGEEDLRAEFERRRADYTTPEKRVVDQLPFKDMAAADAAARALPEGKDFDDIARQYGYSVEEISLGEVTRQDMLSKEIADAAFALEDGKVSAPVMGPLGPVLLRVRQIKSGSERSFTDVQEELKKQLALAQARERLYDFANSVEDARAGGASLAEVSERFGLQMRSVQAVDAQGRGRDGATAGDLPNQEQTLADVFSRETGEEIPMGESKDGAFYWVEVTAITPRHERPFTEVRENVRQLYLREQSIKRLEALALDLVAKGNKGAALAELARAQGASVKESAALGRTAPNEIFSAEALDAVFAAPRGKFVHVPTDAGKRMILRVKEIRSQEADLQTPQVKEFAQQIAEAVNNDLLDQFLQAIHQREGVVVNETVVNTALGVSNEAVQ
jgi:peptidyl-prolyl cis-trans isomerase D